MLDADYAADGDVHVRHLVSGRRTLQCAAANSFHRLGSVAVARTGHTRSSAAAENPRDVRHYFRIILRPNNPRKNATLQLQT